MMKVKNFILLILFTFVFSPNTALACSCFPPPPPCYAFNKSTVVFIGKIKELTRLNEELFFDNVEIEVNQNFRGLIGKTISSHSARSDSACHYIFEKDTKYLFYGNVSEDGKVYSDLGICWRTQPYDNSLIDLDFLNSLNNSTPNYWIWGTVSKGYPDSPVKGIKAEVFDNKRKRIGISDKNGNIKIVVSREGKYKVRLFIPKGVNFNISRWEDQQSVLKTVEIDRKRPYFEYEVEVKNNKCGWFDTTVWGFKN